MNFLKQDKIKILERYILKTGKKQEIPYYDLADQKGNEDIKMYEIENIKNILLFSVGSAVVVCEPK